MQSDDKEVTLNITGITSIIKKYGVPIALVLIVIFAFSMRLSGFFTSEGNYKWPYLRNIDSYLFFRQMDMIVQNGGTAPFYDPYVHAPFGQEGTAGFGYYQYLGAYSYMFTRALIPNLQLWEFLIYFPAFLGAIMSIPIYFIGKYIYNRKAGIIAAALVVFMPSLTSRTLGGDPDSDAIVSIMAFLTLAVFLYTYKTLNEKPHNKHNILFSILTGIVLSLFAYAWAGYWYTAWIMFGTIIIGVALSVAIKKFKSPGSVIKENMNKILCLVIIVISFIAFSIPLITLNGAFQVFTQPFYTAGLFGSQGTLKSEEGIQFPNVYISVAELQTGGNLKDIVDRIGMYIFLISIVSIIYMLYRSVKTKKGLDNTVFLILWLGGALFSSLIAIRFDTILIPVVAIGAGITLSRLWDYVLEAD